MSNNICFYHSADLDGKCSAAITYLAYKKDIELYPINYGQRFPWKKVKGKSVVMVDFCLQPFSEMAKLLKFAEDLIWIDHHQTAIDEYKRFNDLSHSIIRGLRDTRSAACELCWGYFNNKDIPRPVKLLGRFDVWDHSDPDGMPFQYGMQARDLDPKDLDWEQLFEGRNISDILSEGKAILKYQDARSADYIRTHAFETSFESHKAIACNIGHSSSLLFKTIWNPKKYDFMIAFSRLSNQTWTVSLYSDNPGVNVGVIAKKYGGGGHVGAAGFQCKNLPFNY